MFEILTRLVRCTDMMLMRVRVAIKCAGENVG